jgi:hypothetical protein
LAAAGDVFHKRVAAAGVAARHQDVSSILPSWKEVPPPGATCKLSDIADGYPHSPSFRKPLRIWEVGSLGQLEPQKSLECASSGTWLAPWKRTLSRR